MPLRSGEDCTSAEFDGDLEIATRGCVRAGLLGVVGLTTESIQPRHHASAIAIPKSCWRMDERRQTLRPNAAQRLMCSVIWVIICEQSIRERIEADVGWTI